jgi:hypothetical protein
VLPTPQIQLVIRNASIISLVVVPFSMACFANAMTFGYEHCSARFPAPVHRFIVHSDVKRVILILRKDLDFAAGFSDSPNNAAVVIRDIHVGTIKRNSICTVSSHLLNGTASPKKPIAHELHPALQSES